jgi:multifunctional beta-oxidation protein
MVWLYYSFHSELQFANLPLHTFKIRTVLTCVVSQTGASPAAETNEYLTAIEEAKKAKATGTEFPYEEKDVILYNLGIGAKKTDLPLVL